MDGVGIIVVKGHGWGNAIGHVTLWNGTECSDTCHLMSDPDNGTFVPDMASIWVLP
nr:MULTISPECIES: T6SS effector amidase Tae4 family protein [Delftia]